MRGVGRGWAAISIVNALFTGVGAAAAIAIPATSTAELAVAPAGSPGRISIAPDSDTLLVRASVREGIRRFGRGKDLDGAVGVESSVPVAKGLKSSSAVSVAVLRAVAAACGQGVGSETVAALSADASLSAGVSATGAFDDALGSAAGGVVVTDNAARQVKVRGSLDSEWSVVLWTPPGSHAPSPDWAARFRAKRGAALAAVEAAERGEWLVALEANTELVERVMGYDYRPLRRALERLGALGSGVSGLGPTLATLVPKARVRELVRGHPAGSAAVTVVDLVPPLVHRSASA